MLNRSAGCGPVPVSELLDDVIGNALSAAAATDGLVDPTVGGLMERIGYTVTFVDLPVDGPAIDLQIRSAPGWASIEHDRVNRTVTLPEGASIDLGAIGKAWAADRAAIAAAAASRHRGAGVVWRRCGGVRAGSQGRVVRQGRRSDRLGGLAGHPGVRRRRRHLWHRQQDMAPWRRGPAPHPRSRNRTPVGLSVGDGQRRCRVVYSGQRCCDRLDRARRRCALVARQPWRASTACQA